MTTENSPGAEAVPAEHDVVVNDEEQYSIWPSDRELPPGWRVVGYRGAKDACLDHIAEIWVDMRPLSLRRAMERTAADEPVPES